MARICRKLTYRRRSKIWIGLTSIYGIGQPGAVSLRQGEHQSTRKKIKDLTEEEVNQLRQAIESEGRVEGDLRKEIRIKHPAAH